MLPKNYLYKQDLALNNLQELKFHKTQPTNQNFKLVLNQHLSGSEC